MTSVFGVVSFGIAAVAYAVVFVVLLVRRATSRRAAILTGVAAITVVWATVLAFGAFDGAVSVEARLAADVAHLLAWVMCVGSWLGPASQRPWLLSIRVLVGAAVLTASVAVGSLVTLPPRLGQQTAYVALLSVALIGILAVEQVFRNSKEDQRRSLKLLALGVGGMFIADLFVYSQAVLVGSVEPFFWEGRGVVNASLAPLILRVTSRESQWERSLFVSRQVAFYTATLLAIGGYLLALAMTAFVTSTVGGEWGFALQTLFLIAAAAILFVVLFSATLRTRFKVLLVKHFNGSKYDYRHEWLRLTASLGRNSDLKVLVASALDAIARIVGSAEAALWLTRDGRTYECMYALGQATPADVYHDDHPVVRFLATHGWVVDSAEYAREPDRYGTSFGDPADNVLPERSITVPLDCQGSLLGFVILNRTAHVGFLNFDDHDILKTAGRQVAIVLAQALAQEQLAERRQFEAITKLTAFLMHDLKNLIAQQELVVANAQRFRHRPEFVDDAFATVKASVERMRKVLEQLRSTAQGELATSRVDVSKVLMEVRSSCSDREPVPSLSMPEAPALVHMDREKLTSALLHLVRNAQEATPPKGQVSLTLTVGAGQVVLSVIDTGAGMDAAFLRDRLFRPFDTTKGATGMGIGAYQARHFVQASGGELTVTSQVGVGTTVRITLPLAGAESLPAARPRPTGT